MNKIVWITGVSGFLGSGTTRAFIEIGCHVYGLGRRDLNSTQINSLGLNGYVSGGITVDNLNNLLEDSGIPDVIVHCAGSPSVGYVEDNPEIDIANTINTSILLARLQKKYRSIKIIFASSAAVYGVNLQESRLSIKSHPAPCSSYGENKLIAEKIFEYYSNTYSAETISVRFFSLFGPGLKKQLLWDAYRKLTNMEYFFVGTGLETRDFLYIDDAASLILKLAMMDKKTRECYKVINGGTGISTTIDFAIKGIARFICNNSLEVPNISYGGVSRPSDPINLVADLSYGIDNWRPLVPFEVGLEKYISWIKTQN